MDLLTAAGVAGLAYATGGLSAWAAPATEAGAIAAGAASANLIGTSMNNQTSISLANQQQAFSASQASTIYQRGAADLAAAGINPILAYGSPASMGSYVQPNIQPSISMAANAFTSAYDTVSSAGLKHKQSGLTSAQTTTEQNKPSLVAAQTGATTAHTANLKADTVLKHEQAQKVQFEQALIKGSITLQELQGDVMRSQAYLNSESAKNQMSSSVLNRARADLVDVQRMLLDPELRSKLNNPGLHETAAAAEAASKIAQPFLDATRAIGSAIKPGVTINKTFNSRK